MSVILLIRDLAAISQIDGAAARAGTMTRAVSTVAEAVAKCCDPGTRLLVIDLSTPTLDLKSLVDQVKSATNPPRIVAFGPHVHMERLAAAREARCDAVMTRGQFMSQLDVVLRGD